MKIRPQFAGAFAAFALAASALAIPAVSNAEGNCAPNYYWNTATSQCQLCVGVGMYWNYETNQCLFADPTPYVGPVLGPAGPVGVGGAGPVVGPVGPAGVGGVGPVVGPVGPIGIGPR